MRKLINLDRDKTKKDTSWGGKNRERRAGTQSAYINQTTDNRGDFWRNTLCMGSLRCHFFHKRRGMVHGRGGGSEEVGAMSVDTEEKLKQKKLVKATQKSSLP